LAKIFSKTNIGPKFYESCFPQSKAALIYTSHSKKLFMAQIDSTQDSVT
jgi:hypothetical protein